MKRSGWITGVIVVHGSWALTLASISVYLLALVRTSAIRRDIKVPDATAGLKAAAAVLLVLAPRGAFVVRVAEGDAVGMVGGLTC